MGEGGRGGGLTLYAIVHDIEKCIALPFTLMKTCEFGHFIPFLCRNDIEMFRRLKAEVLVCTQNLSLWMFLFLPPNEIRYRVPNNTREKTIPQRRNLATINY